MTSDRSRSATNGALTTLLDSFARQRRYVPERATPINAADELPERLRRLTGAIRPPAAWRAWSEGARVWFVIGRAAKCPRGHSTATALDLLFLSQDGEAVAAGTWGLAPDGGWALSQILQPENAFRHAGARPARPPRLSPSALQ